MCQNLSPFPAIEPDMTNVVLILTKIPQLVKQIFFGTRVGIGENVGSKGLIKVFRTGKNHFSL